MSDSEENIKIKQTYKLYKLYDYNTYDGYSKRQTDFIPYKDNKKFIIQIFGINSLNQSVSIFVEDFKPFFYVKVNDDWTESDKHEFIAHLKKKIGTYYEDSIIESKLIRKQKLYMFDNKKLYLFIQIYFNNTLAYNKTKNLFYEISNDYGIYNKKLKTDGYIFNKCNCYLYEADIPPLIKFFDVRNILPCGWIMLPNNKLIIPKNKTTNCSYEYIISYKDIHRVNKDDIVKYTICSFDIEASSSHGDFPLPIKDYKKLATDIIHNYENLNNESKMDYNEENLYNEIMSAFGYNNISYINKVYPKRDKIKEDELDIIINNLIKYIPINNKNHKLIEELEYSESGTECSEDEEDNIQINYIKKKKIKMYNKKANILEILKDDKCEFQTKILELTKAFTACSFPELEGDIVTFIGMSFINYTEKSPYKRYIIVKGGCKIPEKYEEWVNENNVVIVEKNTEKGVLLEFTRIIQMENPHIVTGYNINGFDFEFMFKRAKEKGEDCLNKFLKLSRNKDEICNKKDWKTGEIDIETTKVVLASGEYNLKFIRMPGRIIVDMCIVFRREFTLSSFKLDYVSSYFISDKIINSIIEDKKTKIISKNLAGLTKGSYVKFEENSYTNNYYKEGKKYEVVDVDPMNNCFVIDSEEVFDKNKKYSWGLAKDDVTPQEIFKLSNGDDYDRWIVGKYCLADCDNVICLLLKLDIITEKVEMSNLCGVPFYMLMERGQGIKLQSYVSKKCGEKNTLMPVLEKITEDDGYEGAHVFKPKTGIYLEEPIACVDYSSLYPSSMISENISHDSKVWTKEYNLENELICETGEKDENNNYIYDNLNEYEYVDIKYDTYKYIRKTAKSAAKKVVVGYKICRYVQFKEGKAIMPSILQELLAARKATKKLMAKETDPFMKNLYDKRQLSIKVTANSLYGQCGARTSAFYEKDVAASTTAMGRKLLFYGRDVIENCYNNIKVKVNDGNDVIVKAECVYGDSVTGYTPVYIRKNNVIEILTIENLGIKYGDNNKWLECKEHGKQDKLYMNIIPGIETWTNNGWTILHRIIKHKLDKNKKILRILTHNGLVDVTDDHSLLKPDETIISPKNIEIGTELLHNKLDITKFITNKEISVDLCRIFGFFFGDGSCGTYICPSCKKSTWQLNNKNLELLTFYKYLCEKEYPEYEWVIMDTIKSSNVYKLYFKSKYKVDFIDNYRELMYYDKCKIIPGFILNASYSSRKAFWKGLYDADGDKDKNGYVRIDQKSQISAANICLLANSLGYNTSINTRKDKPNIYRITCTNKTQRKNPNSIKKIIKIPLDYDNTYVYDLTTENHHFAAGIGSMIVHNTDSVFFKFNLRDIEERKILNKQALIYTIELAQQAGALATKFLKPPHDLEYEKTFYPFILPSKKRYDGMLYEDDPEKCKLKSMGNVLKRRDNAPIVKDIYGGIMDIIMKQKNIQKSLVYLNNCIKDLLDCKYPIEKLTIIKSLRSVYKNPKQIAHKVLADRIGERDIGNKPKSGDRISYAFIVNKNKKALQGEKIETPNYIIENNMELDFQHYLTNQIMKPLLQLYALELENLKEFKIKQEHIKMYDKKKSLLSWEEEIEKLKNKWPEEDKFEKKYEELRQKEVKLLIFDKYIKMFK